jgi:hypothetical protein
MGGQDGGVHPWRSIHEEDDAVVVLRGILATHPVSYARYYGRRPLPTRAERMGELLRAFAAFAFSTVVHLLVLILLAEVLYISAPLIEDIVLTAQLHRPRAVADVSAKEPLAEREAGAKPERAAEAPAVAEKPRPAEAATAPVLGSGRVEIDSRPVAVGVLESLHEVREMDVAHFTGVGVDQGRGEGARREAVTRYGGTQASEASVELGLKWLAEHQMEDGRWSSANLTTRCPAGQSCLAEAKGRGMHGGGGALDSSYDHGVTGLALLAFLGAGYTHQQGAYSQTVDRGLKWLLKRQDARGFLFNSSVAQNTGWPGGMYGHGVSAFALGEACAMTRDDALVKPLQRAVGAIEESQYPNGGWGYTMAAMANQTEFTLSVWQMMGLKAARTAGIEVPAGAVDRAMGFVRKSTDPKGGVFYVPGSHVTQGSTAAGLFARCMFGMTEADWIEKGMAFLDQNRELDPTQGRHQSFEHLYYWYYRTLVAFQLQGRHWQEWNKKLRPYLVSTQRSMGHQAGSWTLIDYAQAGMVYSTALCTLMLETYYRYLPMVGDRSGVVDPMAAVRRTRAGARNPHAPSDPRFVVVALAGGSSDDGESRPPPATVVVVDVAPDTARDDARKRIRSEKSEERYLAARTLAELGDKESVRDMIRAAELERGRLRLVFVSYVGKLKSEEAIPYLVRLLDDPDDPVRAMAVSALVNTTGVYIAEPARWKEWYADFLKRKPASPR